MKPITGQYECLHRSKLGIGLDYYTSRIDRLTLQQNGRFLLIVQDRSRIASAAQSLASGQQMTMAAPETRREGNYTVQGNVITLYFDDGAQEQGPLSWNGEGLQVGPNFFNKVSDSTLLPSTHRVKKDMEDIAKGLKIAGAIGSMALKAAKGFQETIQSVQEPGQTAPQHTPPAQPVQPVRPAQAYAPPQPVQQSAPQAWQGETETLFCDQCGAPARPGKRFCNNCGARLP